MLDSGHTWEEAHQIEYIASGKASGHADACQSAAFEKESLKASNEVLLQCLQKQPIFQKRYSHAEDIALARAVLTGG